jgi:very-short-patch-repair endonuclease
MKEIITFTARNLRKTTTPAEKKFWQALRNRRFYGFKFSRQHPIPFEMDSMKRFFIADFYCDERKLVVEIDGGVHECQKEYDTYRTFIIGQLGMNVIRFTNEDVRYRIEEVAEKLRTYLTP